MKSSLKIPKGNEHLYHQVVCWVEEEYPGYKIIKAEKTDPRWDLYLLNKETSHIIYVEVKLSDRTNDLDPDFYANHLLFEEQQDLLNCIKNKRSISTGMNPYDLAKINGWLNNCCADRLFYIKERCLFSTSFKWHGFSISFRETG